MSGLNHRLEDRSVRVYVGEELRHRLIETARDGRFGGRALKRAFQSLVVDSVSEKIIKDAQEFTGAWQINCDEFGRIFWTRGSGETLLLPAAKGL